MKWYYDGVRIQDPMKKMLDFTTSNDFLKCSYCFVNCKRRLWPVFFKINSLPPKKTLAGPKKSIKNKKKEEKKSYIVAMNAYAHLEPV